MRLADRLRDALTRGHARTDIDVHTTDIRLPLDQVHAPAAVLVAITDRPEPGLILTRRASHMTKHAGQVALPGGRVDPTDADHIAAALREAQEEVAMNPADVEVIGISDPYHTFTGYEITPVLAVVPPDLPLRPHEAEVESVFEVPLSIVLRPESYEVKTLPEFPDHHYLETWWNDYKIWGVTARILINLSHRLNLSELRR